MRVISGKAKGRRLKAPENGAVRPTSDKFKEAVFNILWHNLDGLKVLDLFAGSGGLGIEALSRGAEKAVFVDKNRKCLDSVSENLRVCDLGEYAEVFCMDYRRALKYLSGHGYLFDLVFLDPPYHEIDWSELLSCSEWRELLENESILVVEHDSGIHIEPSNGFEKVDERRYCDSSLTILEWKKGSEGE